MINAIRAYQNNYVSKTNFGKKEDTCKSCECEVKAQKDSSITEEEIQKRAFEDECGKNPTSDDYLANYLVGGKLSSEDKEMLASTLAEIRY